MKRIKNTNGYTIYQAGARDVTKYGFEDGSFYVYFASDGRDFGLTNSTPEFEDCGSLEEAEANCAGNFAIAKEIVEGRTTAASMEEILEVEALLDAGKDPAELSDSYDDMSLHTEVDALAETVDKAFPDANPEQRQAIAEGAAAIKLAPETLENILGALQRVAEAVKEVVAVLVEALQPAIAWVVKAFRQFKDCYMRAMTDNPKWWHLYKHAKKRRTRKKYEKPLWREALERMEALT